MSVGNELSSEVAVTLLEMEGAVNPRDLEDVLALLRSTLRELSSEERGRRGAVPRAGGAALQPRAELD
ncbi:MAG: hypothetical protein JOZ02_17590 [Acidobacteria bacterium]|nr:hypothetical protein [Acidobacteriota bacterium]